MLTVQGLEVRLGRSFALRGISCAVRPGEVLAVLGPNGSGKSTLLRLIAGLAAPSAGSVAWAGAPLSEAGRVLVPPERRGVGLLLQQGVLFPHLDVRANVALGLGPEVEGDPRRLVDEALGAARIAHLGEARVQRLSGGEVQRVALARALAQRPRVMLLDEPFHSLDPVVKRSILPEVRALVRDRGLAAVLVTHDPEEAAALADRALLLRDGRPQKEGTLEELYRAPGDLWAARFFGDVGAVSAEAAAAAGVELPEGRGSGTLRFRPEALALEPAGAGLPVVEVRRALGATEVRVALPDGASLVARCAADAPFAIGGRARARIAWALPESLDGDQPS